MNSNTRKNVTAAAKYLGKVAAVQIVTWTLLLIFDKAMTKAMERDLEEIRRNSDESQRRTDELVAEAERLGATDEGVARARAIKESVAGL